MEGPTHRNLIHILTNHYFGQTVAHVIKQLCDYDQASLKLLKSIEPSLKSDDLKKSLLTLVKYQLVDYVRTIRGFGQNYEYSIVPHRIFSFYRIPQFIKEISINGSQLETSALTILAEKGIMSKSRLVERLIKCIQLDQNFANGGTIAQDVDAVINSLVLRKHLVEMTDNICINIERLERQHRDSLIVETLYNFYNKEPKIQSISKTMIDISLDNTSDDALITAPVPIENLKNLLCPKTIPDLTQLEKYMNRLTTEINYKFFVNSGTHPQKGPMYAIDIGLVIDVLMKEHLCSVVTSRFGTKCCRVFRVLLQRGPLLLKQIEEFIMLPTKDVREYSYLLFEKGLLRNRQIARTPDNAPGKSIFAMYVDMDKVVFEIAELCCATMCNLLTRCEFEVKSNESLLKKHKAVQELMVTSDCDEQNTEEDYFSNHELAQLRRTNMNVDRLLLAKNQVDETLFLAHVWLKLRPNISGS